MLPDQSAAYYPEELALLGQILDQAVQSLPLSMRTPQNRAAIARNILACAATGERDAIELSISTTKPPVVATTSPDPMQQLAPLASNLDVVRRSVEQLAVKQEQMAQNIAALQAVEEDIRQKVSSTPPSPAPQAASIPQPTPPQPKAQPSAVRSSSVPRPPPPAGPQPSR